MAQFTYIPGAPLRMDDDVQDSRDKATAGGNLSYNCAIKTLKDTLQHFRLYGSFQKLEKSLEDLKRNKQTKEEHEECLKVFDKEVQKLSLRFHPDRVLNRGGSGEELENAQKLQSALNATRTVLKVLTEAFLGEIDFDYKYEYFAGLDISLLVNENEINNQITRVLCKISELSEIKRMNVVGEIHNFLVESQKSVNCYLDGKRNEFKKYRDYALYHLRKTIEGYNKLVKECHEIQEECRDEGGDNMKTVVQNIEIQSLEESSILSKLQSVAKGSVKGKFKIFPVCESMDDYHILPFVYYVNVLSMCSLMLEDRRSWFFGIWHNFWHANPTSEKERPLFSKAYFLASYIYDRNQWWMERAENTGTRIFGRTYNIVPYIYNQSQNKKLAEIMGSDGNHPIIMEDVKKKLKEKLIEIKSVLENDFSVSAYKEGKSNKMQLMEGLSKVMADLQEKENTVREWMREYEVKREKNSKTHHVIRGEEEETENKQFTESVSNCTENRKQKLNDIGKFRNGNEEKNDQVLKKEKEVDEKFQESAEQTEKELDEKLSENLLLSKQNLTHKSSSFENKAEENKEKCDQNWICDKNEEKHQKTSDSTEKFKTEFTEPSVESKQHLAKQKIYDKCRNVDQVEEKDDARFEGDLQENLQGNQEIMLQCFKTTQNISENQTQESWTRNNEIFKEMDGGLDVL